MIYIHFPFCRSFCTYCGFYSETEGKCPVKDYKRSLLREIHARRASILQCAGVRTLYVGGGTPSLMPPEDLLDIVSAVRMAETGRDWECGDAAAERIPADFEEFTVEVNPDDITPDYAAALRRIGVNRISMGVQSFCDSSLKWMNRRHSAEGAEKAFGILRESGFDNISIDLIFGYDPSFGEFSDRRLMELWNYDLQKAMSLHPEHLSAYQMGIDEGSTLMDMCESGLYVAPKDELCAEQYAMLQQVASDNGYLQYEVSNFALEGREAVHNSAYWKRVPYVGLGPAAHSFDGMKRLWNVADVRKYTDYYSDCLNDAADSGFSAADSESRYPEHSESATIGAESSCPECSEVRSVCAESPLQSETLTDEDVFVENVMLGLRTSAGIPKNLLWLDVAATGRLLATGSLVEVQGRLRIPASKFFISDSIIRDLL